LLSLSAVVTGQKVECPVCGTQFIPPATEQADVVEAEVADDPASPYMLTTA